MSASAAYSPAANVVVLADLDRREVIALLASYGARLVELAPHEAIPGSYWGESEAGLIGDAVYARAIWHYARGMAFNAKGQPAEAIPEFGQQTPLGRPGQPAELAPAYVFLASPESSYVIGETLSVTGGMPTP